MKLTEYVVRKKLLTKVTLKDALGSYNTDENEAEVTMTFTPGTQWVSDGKDASEIEVPIDTAKANEQANIEVRKLLKWDGAVGSDWLNQANPSEVLEKTYVINKDFTKVTEVQGK